MVKVLPGGTASYGFLSSTFAQAEGILEVAMHPAALCFDKTGALPADVWP